MKNKIAIFAIFCVLGLFGSSVRSSAQCTLTIGSSDICIGDFSTISSTVSGGTWTSSATVVATVVSTGAAKAKVTGVSSGTATITYIKGGSTCTLTVTIEPVPTPSITSSPAEICVGAHVTYSATPTGGTWHSGDATIATVNASTGKVTGVAQGVTLISYKITTCSTVWTSIAVTVDIAAGAISGPTSVCSGSTITLSDGTINGMWTSSNTAVATVGTGSGIVTGVSQGSATITYSVTNACGSSSATYTVTVDIPAGSISGPTAVCTGSNITLTDAGPSGGIWTSSTTTIATVGTSNGVVHGVAQGTATITYSVTNSCGTTYSTYSVQVDVAAGSISGPTAVCVGSNITLADGPSGGNWTSSNTTIATVDPTSGKVSGVAQGSATITYTATNSCGTTHATYAVTVDIPAGTISGATAVCAGSNITLTDVPSGGAWGSTNTTVATIDPVTGVLTGVAAGNVLITYSVTNSCGTTTASLVVTVDIPAGTISGPTAVCVGSNITLLDGPPGGGWTSSNTGIATVDPVSGKVLGISQGSATITYTVTNSCGITHATYAVTVDIPAGPISGPTAVCVGSTITLTDGVPSGGAWTSSNTSVATVDPVTGVVTGVALGVTTITYSVVNSCGTYATYSVTVDVPASAITGPTAVCVGLNIGLLDAAPGGTWTSGSTAIATVDYLTGVVTGVAQGTSTITYSVTNSCGSYTKTVVVTVDIPAGAISGLTAVCVGFTITLSDGPSGGVWTSLNTAIATVDPVTGVVTGVSQGFDNIQYTVTNGCGITNAPYTVHVEIPAGVIFGPSAVCVGSSIHLGDTPPGGTWTSGTTTVATVDLAGHVAGVSQGTSVITYTVSNSCGLTTATTVVTVDVPAGPIFGSTTVCIGLHTLLTDATSGGVWISANTTIATVNSAGFVSGVSGGIVVIGYQVTNSCGITSATTTMTVNPYTAPITGPTAVCVTNSITLTDATPGGLFSSSFADVNVTTAGVVTGINPGTATITYAVNTACGVALAFYTVEVDAPGANILSTATNVCVGFTIPLVGAAPGGTWSSANTSIATVDGSGNVTGVSSGPVTISYNLTNSCGGPYTATVTVIVSTTVTPPGPISGPNNLCMAGPLITLSDATPGGIWSSANTLVVNVTPTGGNVLGLSAGTAIITYSIISSCGIGSVYYNVTVNPRPNPGLIVGTNEICFTGSTALSDPTGDPGGVWTSANTSIATIDPVTGVVSGVIPGAVSMIYTVTNAFGCMAQTGFNMIIDNNPFAGTITGPGTVCVGSVTLYTNVFADPGAWSSGNTSVATIDVSGNVTGVSPGTATISYVATNACGSSAPAIMTITVNPIPVVAAITGPTSVCTGYTIPLTDVTAGGVWMSDNTSIATVDASGNVAGVSAGTTTISYTVTSGGCSMSSTYVITVNATPSAGSISGPSVVCSGSTITLSDGAGGGVWSSSNTAVATISGGGVVSPVTPGTTIISYTVTSGPCAATATMVVTSGTTPTVGGILGTYIICAATTTTLTDAVTGGVWTSSTTSVATINPSTGLVTGVSGGTSTITYTVTSGVCSASTTYVETISPLPNIGAITGSNYVCVGYTTPLTDATGDPGGTWTSSNTAVATVTSGGLLAGITIGTAIISYSLTNSCATLSATLLVTVGSGPSAGTITGPSYVCTGSFIMLSDGSTGGTWTSTNTTVAIIDLSSGVISGLAAGTTTISYTITSACGTAFATYAATVYPTPNAGTINGISAICAGSNTTLSDPTGDPGGLWTSFNTTIATVGAGTGNVHGVAGGLDLIYYTVASAYCGTVTATYTMTVDVTPTVTAIHGATVVCISSTTTLTDATFGGVWTSTNTGIATINPSTGVVSPVAAGTAIISYTITNSCGSVSATFTITVATSIPVTIAPNPSTFAYPIGGPYGSVPYDEYQFCDLEVGATLIGTPAGGTFAVVDPYMTGYATINATTGVITPNTLVITPASVFKIGGFTYTVSSGCGSGTAEWKVFIDADHIVPTIYPPTGTGWPDGSTTHYQGTFQAAPYSACGFYWCQNYSASCAHSWFFTYMGLNIYNEVEVYVPATTLTPFTVNYNITNTCTSGTGGNTVSVIGHSN